MTLRTLSISGLATLNLHSLNNEGGEGNHIQTRMVDVVDKDGNLHPVNAVSGDMFKHIFAEHFQAIAKEEGLTLCAGCQTLNANRLNADPAFEKAINGKSNIEILDLLPVSCALDDVAGILITQGNRALGRKSVVEFSWVPGVPEKVKTGSYFHVKYDPQGRGKTDADDGSNKGQAIFHRPASSGQYALVAHVEAHRIGLNDITREYAISEEERQKRLRAVLRALTLTFLHPGGAMRNTQSPHLTDFQGVITTSDHSVPAPTVSALNDDFAAQVKGIAAALEKMSGKAVGVHDFGSLAQFAEKMSEITV
ncbi:DevR family CRISPR-associated autoregulator [Deinococcus wulumuqiensis]|uniref:CRISPR-associated protein DevR n=1 Tax=Deinococcus wulumuqiensis TaxID=980427 RepID=A0AAV4K2X0_9DEIO|nr:DevR family CRISPR-associated autoregulator [Deinococcus wulumuqiensis]QII19973.1 DevR family CRISPR-associated autoregulator [Deinococcus wulumuqiensis R12]GGI74012.1 CRISPR-associated protein DevR [Deinococcus wulumuqiensis]GGP29820.1 CRISPR-associated protein DevR [Deinococcus wulumuqiensis]